MSQKIRQSKQQRRRKQTVITTKIKKETITFQVKIRNTPWPDFPNFCDNMIIAV